MMRPYAKFSASFPQSFPPSEWRLYHETNRTMMTITMGLSFYEPCISLSSRATFLDTRCHPHAAFSPPSSGKTDIRINNRTVPLFRWVAGLKYPLPEGLDFADDESTESNGTTQRDWPRELITRVQSARNHAV